MAEKYRLKVMAGSAYNEQEEVHVNTAKATKISTEHIDASINVRIKNYKGQEADSSPDSAYFTHPSHTKDRYSISFTFSPKANISGKDLVFGNDFDHPIRDRLPAIFGPAFSYVTKFIDPGLYGDPYADTPYLYGPLLSSVNILRIGGIDGIEKLANEAAESGKERVVEEGADDESAEKIRSLQNIPATGPARMKFFLQEKHKDDFEFEKGRVYSCDFFNPYLDFSDFSIRLPLGLSVNVLSFWDGQALRYVLRNRATNTLLFVVSFTLIPIDGSEPIATGKVKDVIGETDETSEKTEVADSRRAIGSTDTKTAIVEASEKGTNQGEKEKIAFVDEGVD